MYTIDGNTYTEGEEFRIRTPELGAITGIARFDPISTPLIVVFNMGWIRTPLPCGSVANATLQFTSKRIPASGPIPPYSSDILVLTYHCKCQPSAHSRCLQWYVSFDKGVIRSVDKGWDRYNSTVHNHPIAEQKVQHRVQYEVQLVAKPEVVHQADQRGQFQLF